MRHFNSKESSDGYPSFSTEKINLVYFYFEITPRIDISWWIDVALYCISWFWKEMIVLTLYYLSTKRQRKFIIFIVGKKIKTILILALFLNTLNKKINLFFSKSRKYINIFVPTELDHLSGTISERNTINVKIWQFSHHVKYCA